MPATAKAPRRARNPQGRGNRRLNTESQADTTARTWPMPAMPPQLLRAVAARPGSPAASAAVARGARRLRAPAPDRVTTRHHLNPVAEGEARDQLTPGPASGTPPGPDQQRTPAITRRRPADPARAARPPSRATNHRHGVRPLMVARHHVADQLDWRVGFETGDQAVAPDLRPARHHRHARQDNGCLLPASWRVYPCFADSLYHQYPRFFLIHCYAVRRER